MTLRLIDGALPSSHDLHIWARRSRALMIGASLCRLTRVVVEWLCSIAAARMSEMRQRRAIRELHELDDRMLSDIGLGRSTIEFVVRNVPRSTAPRIGRGDLIRGGCYGQRSRGAVPAE
jgi:uncharacterized protein YjiS (DUF1127 family)